MGASIRHTARLVGLALLLVLGVVWIATGPGVADKLLGIVFTLGILGALCKR